MNYELRHARSPQEVSQMNTGQIREDFLIPDLFSIENEFKIVYSMYDRMIVGGIKATSNYKEIPVIDQLKAPYFLHRREMGIFNIGEGEGTVKVDDKEFVLGYKEALYLGKGERKIFFKSNSNKPALFYFNSAPAHHTFPDKKVTKKEAIIVELGDTATANKRTINKLIVREVLETCQLQMGLTELHIGNVWNTMPAHTHSRRMEVYLYLEVPQEQTVCHFMGEPYETRHVFMKKNDAIISPAWSIHAGCATHNYSFIWSMCGENLDYGDMDTVAINQLK